MSTYFNNPFNGIFGGLAGQAMGPMLGDVEFTPYGGAGGRQGGGGGMAWQKTTQPGWVGDANDAWGEMAALNAGLAAQRYQPQAKLDIARDTNRSNERIVNSQLQQREGTLAAVLPALIRALGGIGGGGMTGMRTDYGAGFGSNAQPTNTQQYRHPIVSYLDRMVGR